MSNKTDKIIPPKKNPTLPFQYSNAQGQSLG